MLEEKFGTLVNSTKERLEKHFNHPVTKFREYFEFTDALVAELYHTEQPDLRTY